MTDHLSNMHEQIKQLAQEPNALLVEEYKSLEDKIVWFDYAEKGKQCAVQYNPADPDMTQSGVGRLTVPDERVYNKLNPLFEGTMIEKIINRYELFRTRLMWVGPKTCYSMHRDKTRRIHIPIITNPECYFVFADHPPVHCFPGYAWGVDTKLWHTFMNCSEQPRLHLVGCTLV
jgi:hypothetical protein